MELTERATARNTVYRGGFLTLNSDTVELPNGKLAKREYVDHPGAVCILPITADGQVVFVRQYRYAVGQELRELPAGKLDPGESPEACAMRELREETGFTAAALTPLGSILPSPGCISEVLHLFYAEGLTAGEASPDEDEFLTLFTLPIAEAVNMAARGELADAKTVVALLRYAAVKKAD